MKNNSFRGKNPIVLFYHINMINHIIDEALSYLNNKLDIINISSAGVISNSRILYAKIYENVTEKDKIKNLYLNIIDTLKNKINSKNPNYIGTCYYSFICNFNYCF